MTAIWAQLSRVQTWVMSPAHLWFGALRVRSTLKSRGLQEVRCDIEGVIAVGGVLELAVADDLEGAAVAILDRNLQKRRV